MSLSKDEAKMSIKNLLRLYDTQQLKDLFKSPLVDPEDIKSGNYWLNPQEIEELIIEEMSERV